VQALALDWQTFLYLITHLDLTSAEITELLLEKYRRDS